MLKFTEQSNNDIYWGEVSKARMEEYLELIEKDGFDVFKDRLFSKDRGFYDFIFGEVRADWRFCLPVKKDWKVLDIGAGLGANSFVLAKEVSEVVSMERAALRLKFLDLRKKREGADNIKIISGDALDLPFEDESFDLIVANGFFEWVGVTDKFSSPKRAQEHFLGEAMRVLKRGGFLYIGIENRFAANFFWGGIDHSGLRLTSWMPRFLANFYTRLRTGKKYQTYTYSKRGYEKILERAGFKDIEFYLPLPGYNVPKYIVPYNHLAGLRFVAKRILGGESPQRKLLKKIIGFPGIAGLWRLLFFSFAIFAQKK